MKQIYLRASAAVVLTVAIAACVPRTTPPPRPAPTPVSTVAPPAPAPSPTYSSWMDVPATPGNWTYQPSSSGGTARFGEAQSDPRFTMTCDRTERLVHLERSGQAGGQVPVTIRAETADRTIASLPVVSAQPAIRTSLAASDRLLDAMALSKGRFAIETPGLPTLYLPAWPEVTRVVEDCR